MEKLTDNARNIRCFDFASSLAPAAREDAFGLSGEEGVGGGGEVGGMDCPGAAGTGVSSTDAGCAGFSASSGKAPKDWKTGVPGMLVLLAELRETIEGE